MNNEKQMAAKKDFLDSEIKTFWVRFLEGDYPGCIQNCDAVINYYLNYYSERDKKKYVPEEVIKMPFLDKKFKNIWFLKGIVLESLGKFDKSEEFFERIPSYELSENWYLLGDIFSGEPKLKSLVNNPEMAFEFYDRALEIDPKNMNAWLKKGSLYERLGNKNDAKVCYKNISWKELLGLNVFIPALFLILGICIIGISLNIWEKSWYSWVGIIGQLVTVISFIVLIKTGRRAVVVFFKRF